MRTLSIKEWIAIGISLVIIFYFFLFSGSGPLMPQMGENATTTLPVSIIPTNSTTTNNQMNNQTEQNIDGMIVRDTFVGTGAEAKAGSIIAVHYTGKLQDGRVFDSSIPRGEPFIFKLGQGSVIQGWEKGFAGMKVGGKRTLIIPPLLGYGAQDVKNRSTGEVIIPANSTLTFDVELVGVQ